jgi:pantoate--beta-alanine ligase
VTQPVVLRTPAEIARWRPEGALGLVPTMGALHAGHASLIERAAAECEAAIVSIFVNPTQFNDSTDLERYPRPFERDVAVAGQHGAAAIYAPAVETVYPPGHATTVHVAGVTERWEGAHRPGHFDGVATVVTILLNQVRPDRAYFGEKDWQQLAMLRRLAADLSLPGEIVAAALVRDEDGLALSSRNARLSPEERAAALVIPRTLAMLRAQIAAGERSVRTLLTIGGALLAGEQRIRVEYLTIVDPVTLEPVETIIDGARALVAVWAGETRLIDTMDLTADRPGDEQRPQGP